MSSFLGDDEDVDLNELTDEQHESRLNTSLAKFWEQQNKEMQLLEIGTEQDFKNHNDLPLARIKRFAFFCIIFCMSNSSVHNSKISSSSPFCHIRIMKSDEDVRMISAEGEKKFLAAALLPSAHYCLSHQFYTTQHPSYLPKLVKCSSWSCPFEHGVLPKSPRDERCRKKILKPP